MRETLAVTGSRRLFVNNPRATPRRRTSASEPGPRPGWTRLNPDVNKQVLGPPRCAVRQKPRPRAAAGQGPHLPPLGRARGRARGPAGGPEAPQNALAVKYDLRHNGY